jgi:tetratricopeptide (TPR) repeat protein
MSLRLRTINPLPWLVAITFATALSGAAQESGNLDKRDLQIQKMPATPPLSHLPSIPRGYAVVIGVAKYEKLAPEDDLSFPETDADAIRQVLISKQGGAFPDANVRLLVGRDATLQNMREALEEWLPSHVQEQDRALVYFAGHGFVKGGRGYLAPWDVDPASPETTAYPMDLVGKDLESVKAKWKVLLVDACHSGKIVGESTDEAVNAQLAQLPSGFLNLTATGARESSYEDPRLGFGVFSYFVKKGLEGNADASPCDGVITAEELVDYVRREVSSYVRRYGKSQTPTDHERDYDNNMILGVNPRCVDTAQPPPAPLGSLIIEANMDGVEVFLDDADLGSVTKDKPLREPGLATGIHHVKGVKSGYEPVTKEVMVIPGQEQTVTLRIQYRREAKPAAMRLVDRGEALLFGKNSSLNPVAIYFHSSGQQKVSDLERARDLFREALREDPRYAKATFDLALTCQQLSDYDCALKGFQETLRTEPTYVEARLAYAGALIEEGDADEAIRQLREVISADPSNAWAHSQLSLACLNAVPVPDWPCVMQAADKSIALDSGSYEPYLWKADALRRVAASENDALKKSETYRIAADNYRTVLRMTNFKTPVPAKLAFYLGLPMGHRSHADRQVSYANDRQSALMGLCDSEDKLGNYLRALNYCSRAVEYDPKEPLSYWLLGNLYRDMFNSSPRRDYLLSARANYCKMIEINPDLEQSPHAETYVHKIDELLLRMK